MTFQPFSFPIEYSEKKIITQSWLLENETGLGVFQSSIQHTSLVQWSLFYGSLKVYTFFDPPGIVLRTKLLSHDLNAFCRVRLLSRDAKSMLNVATFLKMVAARHSMDEFE